jgi:hypothetical protein
MSIQRAAKGKRPVFTTGEVDKSLNQLLAIISSLSAEVAVLRDRQRTVEQLLAERGSVTLEDIENYDPGIEDLAERNVWQQGFLRRIYYIFEQDAEQLALNQEAPTD